MDRRAMMKYLARPPVIPITNQRARFEDRQMQYFFDKRIRCRDVVMHRHAGGDGAIWEG